MSIPNGNTNIANSVVGYIVTNIMEKMFTPLQLIKIEYSPQWYNLNYSTTFVVTC